MNKKQKIRLIKDLFKVQMEILSGKVEELFIDVAYVTPDKFKGIFPMDTNKAENHE